MVADIYFANVTVVIECCLARELCRSSVCHLRLFWVRARLEFAPRELFVLVGIRQPYLKLLQISGLYFCCYVRVFALLMLYTLRFNFQGFMGPKPNQKILI